MEDIFFRTPGTLTYIDGAGRIIIDSCKVFSVNKLIRAVKLNVQ